LRELTEQEREELSCWARSRTLSARDVFVAWLILALNEGKSYSVIEAELNTSRPTIARWKRRFEELGIGGFGTAAQGQ
jgi:transposase